MSQLDLGMPTQVSGEFGRKNEFHMKPCRWVVSGNRFGTISLRFYGENRDAKLPSEVHLHVGICKSEVKAFAAAIAEAANGGDETVGGKSKDWKPE